MTKDEIITQLKSYLLEAYDSRLLVLSSEADALGKARENLERKFRTLKSLKDSVEINLNRATEEDLRSYCFLFFGRENP